MRNIFFVIVLLFLLIGCKTKTSTTEKRLNNNSPTTTDFVITFGSCNKHNVENIFWDDILGQNPDVFIWGGDIIYADTDDITKLREFYDMQDAVPGYSSLKKETFITGTWDDHDYGLNDGGVEFSAKKGSQQAFLDFMDVPERDARRERDGVYSSQLISKPNGSVKIINLDTRFFRTNLTDDKAEGRRYRANDYGEGTILGVQQWTWLQDELNNSKADFNLIISSIQFLSDKHGFEKWANHPAEVDKMKQIISSSKAKGVIILSGDRHISEFSKTDVEGMSYPLLDFTSSGLTHSYSSFSGEPNPYRVGDVTFVPSYGLIEINVESSTALLKIMGDNGEVLQELKQRF